MNSSSFHHSRIIGNGNIRRSSTNPAQWWCWSSRWMFNQHDFLEVTNYTIYLPKKTCSARNDDETQWFLIKLTFQRKGRSCIPQRWNGSSWTRSKSITIKYSTGQVWRTSYPHKQVSTGAFSNCWHSLTSFNHKRNQLNVIFAGSLLSDINAFQWKK